MIVVFYGWLLFRAQSMSQIMDLTTSLFDWSFPVWISSYVLNLVVFMAPLASHASLAISNKHHFPDVATQSYG
jgi:hypothetical protein